MAATLDRERFLRYPPEKQRKILQRRAAAIASGLLSPKLAKATKKILKSLGVKGDLAGWKKTVASGQWPMDSIVELIIKEVEEALETLPALLAEELQEVWELVSSGQLPVTSKTVKELGAVKDADDFRRAILRLNTWWIKEHYEGVADTLKPLLLELYEKEVPYTIEEFADKLSKAFEAFEIEDDRYWYKYADYASLEVKNLTMINDLSEGGGEFVKVVAILDENTTAICRAMNGRVIPIGHLKKQMEKIFASGTKEELQQARTYNAGRLFNFYDGKAELPPNVGIPPYHYGCRTELVGYFPEFEEGKSLREYPVEYEYTENEHSKAVSHKEKATAIYTVFSKPLSREIILTDKRAEHIDKKLQHYLTSKEAMNHTNYIIETAESLEASGEILALTSKASVISFRGGNYVHTAFIPEKGSQKKARAYFLKWTKPRDPFAFVKAILKSLRDKVKL